MEEPINEFDQTGQMESRDKVASVSLSWDGACDDEIKWRYYHFRKVIEETVREIMARDYEFSSQYYAPCKAKVSTFTIIKARKL